MEMEINFAGTGRDGMKFWGMDIQSARVGGEGYNFCAVADHCLVVSVLGHYLLFHFDVELANTLQCQFLLLHQNTNWFTHEALGNLQHIGRHCRRQQNYLPTDHNFQQQSHTNQPKSGASIHHPTDTVFTVHQWQLQGEGMRAGTGPASPLPHFSFTH